MIDYENLPSGISQYDAGMAGANQWDDRQAVGFKVQNYEQEKHNRAMNEAANEPRAQQDGFTQAHSSSGFAYSPDAVVIRTEYLRQINIMSAGHLAGIIEIARRKLVFEREQITKRTQKIRKMSIYALAITFFLFFFGTVLISFPLLFVYLMFLPLKTTMLALGFVIYKTSSTIKKSITDEEKRLNNCADCIIIALKKSYEFKVNTAKNHHSSAYLLGRFEVPSKDLTAKFLHSLNQQFQRTTGAPMQYNVYRFKKLWDKGFFIPGNGVLDQMAIDISDPVPLAELEVLAK